MGKKVDITEVSELSSDLSSAAADITTQLDRINSNVDQIIAMDSFSGEAARQAKRYFIDLHKTVLASFSQLFMDLDDQLKENLNKFQSSVDSSVTAIVESNYLNDTELEITDGYENINAEHQAINRTINNISDISSVSVPYFSSVTNNKTRVVETIFDLEDDLTSFTSERNQRDTHIKDVLNHIEVTINRANTQSGSARFTDYQTNSTTVGLAALKDYSDTNLQEQMENLTDEERAIIAKAEEDYENGKIDWSTLESIRSGVIATGTAFLKNLVQNKLTDEVAKTVAAEVINWAQRNTIHFMDLGLVAAPVYGNVQTFTAPPSTMSNVIRTGARYGVPIIGTLIDFGIQVHQGENVTDAAVKSVGHLGAAVTGATIGTAIGGPVGTIVGGVIGVAGSMAFDLIYDNKELIIDKALELGEGLVNTGEKILDSVVDVGKDIGEAVSGFFGNLGSVFG